MSIELEPEVGIPLDAEEPYVDLRERAEAICETAKELKEHGYEFDDVTPKDKEVAATLATSYASDSEKTSKQATTGRVQQLTPQSLVMTGEILKEFGQSVVQSSQQIRHMVTNKLILETENNDPRVRLKALELLGKVSDVGLFSEKSEVTITHQSSDDLKQQLKQKLERMINPEPTTSVQAPILINGDTDPEYVAPEPKTSIADIDVDDIL